MQENRRVCKFPCTSRGEGPALGRQLRGGRGKRRAGAPFTARTRRRKPAAGPPLRSSGGRPCGAPPPPAHISPNAAAPAFPGPAPGRQLRGAGASGGSVSRLQPVQGAGNRPQAPAAAQRGAPLRGALPGRSPGGLRPYFPLHRPAQRGEALPPRAQQQRLQLLAPQGSLQRGAGQRKLGTEAGRLFQGVILPEGHKIVVLPAQQRPQPGRTAA